MKGNMATGNANFVSCCSLFYLSILSPGFHQCLFLSRETVFKPNVLWKICMYFSVFCCFINTSPILAEIRDKLCLFEYNQVFFVLPKPWVLGNCTIFKESQQACKRICHLTPWALLKAGFSVKAWDQKSFPSFEVYTAVNLGAPNPL